jgi:hypothetical protein
MQNNNQLALIALVAALALLGVIAVTVVTITQEAEARGCNRSVPFNASQGRCFRP